MIGHLPKKQHNLNQLERSHELSASGTLTNTAYRDEHTVGPATAARKKNHSTEHLDSISMIFSPSSVTHIPIHQPQAQSLF